MLNKNQTVAVEQLGPPHYSAPTSASPMVRQLQKALRIVRMKQMPERTGLSRATLYVLMATDPTFPTKVKLSARAIGFLESDVDGWIASRVCK
ncbi:hypothetical protein WL74_00700 [Burkholderia cepacia]|uniref:helix-turn-helix transcriptional regulator n=1 Tax=Burkholderia TaxID=32008 RepID=UPI00053100A4|nr:MULTISPECIES: AlpA family phage regulatory protein [Burkholderia]KGS17756.1 prophage CP4-57 regulatory family protein [Burkholderia pseudomallei MSHR4378]KGW58918.1 prophage CP4-57 regulatory family protein [Burkholderia pseudomallei MSHR1357]KGW65909.1 prophage CP4-57 regulatory family protein [Burkholderia pseudomallei MSHR1029]KKC14861.1 prophage CP4-57 regulatory family protein [Burkholderia pseudomallei MSHR1328]KWE28807.1 hypothetical protein WL74_00700 [Burkholderia cepacia]